MKKLLTIVTSIGLALALTGCKKKKLKIDLKDKGPCIGNGYENHNWYDEYNRFIPVKKYETIYDEKNNKVYDLEYMWFNRKEWSQLDHMTEYVYDDNGLLIKSLKSLDYSYNTLSKAYRYEEYEYNGDKLITKKEYSKANGLESTETYTYDSFGNVSSVTYNGTSKWKREYTYNSNNQKTSVLYYEYNTKTNGYNDAIIENSYEYDEKGNLIVYAHTNTGGYNNVYDAYSYKEVYTYDSNNKKREKLGYILKNGEYIERAKFIYDYYENGNCKDLTCYIKKDGEWANNYKLVYFTTIYND